MHLVPTSAIPWREAPAARFAVIGDPVAHSLSPRMQAAALEALGEPGEYLAVHVPPDDVVPALDHLELLGYEGINVTVPHKSAVIPWLREVEPFARRVGAVNTIRVRDRSGINTDAPGFLQVLAQIGIAPPATILVLGAGGTTRSLLPALEAAGFRTLLWNRTPERADALGHELDLKAEIVPDLGAAADAQVIVNATSASLSGVRLPVSLHKGQWAIDLAYAKDGPTPFLADAAAQGAQTMDGRPLLAAQGALSLGYWLGRPVDPTPMRAALGLD